MEWLADAGHACHILTTARFESAVTFTIEDHLGKQGVDVSSLAPPHGPSKRSGKKRRAADRSVVNYAVRDVPVTLLLTRHNDESRPDRAETRQWYDAVCTLWDNPVLYRSVAARAHQIAEERYSERVSRKKHVDYFTSLKSGGRPIAARAETR
jgi:hypothetical protein